MRQDRIRRNLVAIECVEFFRLDVQEPHLGALKVEGCASNVPFHKAAAGRYSMDRSRLVEAHHSGKRFHKALYPRAHRHMYDSGLKSCLRLNLKTPDEVEDDKAVRLSPA